MLEELFRIPHQTLGIIVAETCQALWDVLQPMYLKTPDSTVMWNNVMEGFEKYWNYPHCVGAIDGKHCQVLAPEKSGTLFDNYKGTFSIVLWDVANFNYEFLYVEIEAPGSEGDAGLWGNSSFRDALESGQLNIPIISDPCAHLIGDDGFALEQTLMKPYCRGRPLTMEEKVFNYRLSRARHVVENAFRLLAARFCIFRGPILLRVDNACRVVQSAVVLHNFLLREQPGAARKIICKLTAALLQASGGRKNWGGG